MRSHFFDEHTAIGRIFYGQKWLALEKIQNQIRHFCVDLSDNRAMQIHGVASGTAGPIAVDTNRKAVLCGHWPPMIH